MRRLPAILALLLTAACGYSQVDIRGNAPGQTKAIREHLADTVGHITAAERNLWNAALQAEEDLKALRAYHYGDPDIVESPAEWFTVEDGFITSFNYTGPLVDVVIPWEWGGEPVTDMGPGFGEAKNLFKSITAPRTITEVPPYLFTDAEALVSVSFPAATSIGGNTFAGTPLTSLSLPSVISIWDNAFEGTPLTSLSLPSVISIGEYAFYGTPLTSLYLSTNAPTVGTDAFPDTATIYVTDPAATGYGATLGGRPVVRLPLHTDSLTLGGVAKTEWPVESDPAFTNWLGTDPLAGYLPLSGGTMDAPATIQWPGGGLQTTITKNEVSAEYITGGLFWIRGPGEVYGAAMYAEANADVRLSWGDQSKSAIFSVPPTTTETVAYLSNVAAAANAATNYVNAVNTVTTKTLTSGAAVTIGPADGRQPQLDLGTAATITLSGYPVTGVNRVSLVIKPNKKSIGFPASGYNLDDLDTAKLDTNDWVTLLFRQVNGGNWKVVVVD